MADFIDREELKLQIAKQSRYFGFGFINKIIAIINEQPSADTERHARWIRINDVLSQCSNCKTTILRFYVVIQMIIAHIVAVKWTKSNVLI